MVQAANIPVRASVFGNVFVSLSLKQ